MLSRKIVAGLLKAPQQAFSTYKTSTGLVGLAVDLDGRQNLINVSAQILESVKVLLCVCKNSRPWSRRRWVGESLRSWCCLLDVSLSLILLPRLENPRAQRLPGERGEVVQIYFQDGHQHTRRTCLRPLLLLLP